MDSALRFVFEEGRRGTFNLGIIISDILIGLEKVDLKKEVFCIQDFTFQGIYDVFFESYDICLRVSESLKVKKSNGVSVLEGITIVPIYAGQEVPIVVHMFNPRLSEDSVRCFLMRYCTSVRGGYRLKNNFGVFNGKVKFFCKLKLDPSSPGDALHPPANFTIGGDRCYLSYYNMPKYCRNCFSFGHIRDNCEKGRVCRNCQKEGHHAGDCPEERKCDFCGKPGHAFKNCPEFVDLRRQHGAEHYARAEIAQKREAARKEREAAEQVEKPQVKSSEQGNVAEGPQVEKPDGGVIVDAAEEGMEEEAAVGSQIEKQQVQNVEMTPVTEFVSGVENVPVIFDEFSSPERGGLQGTGLIDFSESPGGSINVIVKESLEAEPGVSRQDTGPGMDRSDENGRAAKKMRTDGDVSSPSVSVEMEYGLSPSGLSVSSVDSGKSLFYADQEGAAMLGGLTSYPETR